MKRKTFLQIAQSLAIGLFVGISAFGILVYFFGTDEANPMPAIKSVLLGLVAFGSMAIIVILGGMIDRESAKEGDPLKKTENGKDSP